MRLSGRYMLSRGRGLFRQEWYSVCSLHGNHDPRCDLCQQGEWVNVVRQLIGSAVFKAAPWLWRWWANRGTGK